MEFKAIFQTYLVLLVTCSAPAELLALHPVINVMAAMTPTIRTARIFFFIISFPLRSSDRTSFQTITSGGPGSAGEILPVHQDFLLLQ